jgi:arsenical pump membrane protein
MSGVGSGRRATGRREPTPGDVDLGPNFSVTGSLATILWLAALRRDGFAMNGGTVLKTGLLVTPPALLAALGAALLFQR